MNPRKNSPDVSCRFEPLEPRLLLSGSGLGDELQPIEIPGLELTGSIHGVKWQDIDGDGQRDANEPGLAGVTIYSDRNNNGVLDPGERRTVTMQDDPNTAVNETGRYWLDGLLPGERVVWCPAQKGPTETAPAERRPGQGRTAPASIRGLLPHIL